MSDSCTSEQAIAAIGYLRHSFGGHEIPEQEERSFLRTFRKFAVNEVQEAIDRSKTYPKRPSPADIESSIITARAKMRRDAAPSFWQVNPAEITPAKEVEKHVNELRELMGVTA